MKKLVVGLALAVLLVLVSGAAERGTAVAGPGDPFDGIDVTLIKKPANVAVGAGVGAKKRETEHFITIGAPKVRLTGVEGLAGERIPEAIGFEGGDIMLDGTLPIDFLGLGVSVLIDMDPTGNSANGPLSSIETCKAVPIGGTISIDIVIDEVDAADLMQAFQAELNFDPGAVNVTAVDTVGQMIAVNAGSAVVDFSDPVPDFDGTYLAAAADLGGPAAYESGKGVLTRIDITGVGPAGISPLGLGAANTIILNQNSAAIPILLSQNGPAVAVGDVNGDTVVNDSDCPPPPPPAAVGFEFNDVAMSFTSPGLLSVSNGFFDLGGAVLSLTSGTMTFAHPSGFPGPPQVIDFGDTPKSIDIAEGVSSVTALPVGSGPGLIEELQLSFDVETDLLDLGGGLNAVLSLAGTLRFGPSPVGGIVELPVGGSDAPASAAAGSGSASPPYAAIAGAAAAAAVALAASGWHVRRRWMR